MNLNPNALAQGRNVLQGLAEVALRFWRGFQVASARFPAITTAVRAGQSLEHVRKWRRLSYPSAMRMGTPLDKLIQPSPMPRCILASSRQGTGKCSVLRASGFPPQAGQPYGTWDGFVRGAVVADHAPTDPQCLGSRGEREIIAVHPLTEHLVADFAGLLLGPGVDVVRAEFRVDSLDAVSPLAEVNPGEYRWIQDRSQDSMLAQHALDIDFQHFSGIPRCAKPIRRHRLDGVQLGEKVFAQWLVPPPFTVQKRPVCCNPRQFMRDSTCGGVTRPCAAPCGTA